MGGDFLVAALRTHGDEAKQHEKGGGEGGKNRTSLLSRFREKMLGARKEENANACAIIKTLNSTSSRTIAAAVSH